jgi:L-threonylcarbamoyladenylate synthase
MTFALKKMAEIGQDIAKALALLNQGELVAIPTETVYGLAGNALDAQAISKIFEAKNRPSFDPLIMHCASWEAAQQHLQADLPAEAKALAAAFWPGPLTLLLPKAAHVPDLLSSGLPRVAVRVPKHPLSLALLKQLDFPLAAPSANPFGYISPTRASHVQDQLGDKLAYILDGGPCTVGVESTIIGFEDGQAVLYRPGGIAMEDIVELIGEVQLRQHSSSNPHAPGMLETHYAPRKKVYMGDLDALMQQYADEDFAVLSFTKEFTGLPTPRQFALSTRGDLREAASRLFEGLRYLDNSDASLILVEPVPHEGLGLAINDRLKRASA